MAEYDGVKVQEQKTRGEIYVHLWWYIGIGSKRSTCSLGRRSGLTKATINRARLAKEKELALQPGRIGAGQSPTWGSWVDQYLELRADLSVGSVRLVNQACDYLSAWLVKCKRGKQTRLDQLTRSDVARFRLWLSEQTVKKRAIQQTTVAKHISTLSTVFGSREGALKLDLIPYNPFDREKKSVKTETKGHPDFTPEQIEDLFNACPNTAWRSLVALCLLSGVRLGEALSLAWDDVQWGEGRFIATSQKLTGNKPKQRTVMMEPELEQVLLAGFEAGDQKPAAISSHNLTKNMKEIIKRAGMQPWKDSFHALRRWRDSTWKLKHPEYVVDAWLAHSAQVSREHYLTVPEHLYRPPGIADKIKARIDEMSADELEWFLKKIEDHQAKRGEN